MHALPVACCRRVRVGVDPPTARHISVDQPLICDLSHLKHFVALPFPLVSITGDLGVLAKDVSTSKPIGPTLQLSPQHPQ